VSSWLAITSKSPTRSVVGRLGPNGAVPTEAYGGWTEVTRPRRVSLLVWQGRKPFRMSVNVVLDGFIDNDPIEMECQALEHMALPVSKGDEPAVVSIFGDGIPHVDLKWVIDDITWEDVIRRPDGKRLRQVLTLDLREHVESKRLKEEKASSIARNKADAAKKKKQTTNKGKKTTKGKSYLVKSGDSLSKIAAHELGSAARWHEIADLNDIRTPKSIKVGQTLKLP